MRDGMIPPVRGAAGVLLCVLAAACGAEREPGPAPPGAEALTGVWRTELVLADPLLPRHGTAAPPVARGDVSLLRDDDLRAMPGLHGRPTHVGVHTLVLRGFGFEPRPAGKVPAVAARWYPPDSVELAFEAAAGSGELLTVLGRIHADSIVGEWHFSTRASGAAGPVVMHRGR
jgi:hypothetical protein